VSTDLPQPAGSSTAKKSTSKQIARLVGAAFVALLPLLHLASQPKRKKAILWTAGALALTALVFGGVLFFSLPKSTTALQDLKDPNIPQEVTIKKLMEETAELMGKNKFKQAEENVKELFRLVPENASIHTLSGALKSLQKDFEAARVDYQAALRLNPKSFSAAFNLAEVDFVTGNYTSAQEQFQTLLNARPTDEVLLFRIYLCALMENQPRLAAATLEKFPPVGKTPARQYAEAARLYSEKRAGEARKILSTARVLYPEKTKFFDSSLKILGYQ
jgi:tetratricopeptide (TPR) repeat protein